MNSLISVRKNQVRISARYVFCRVKSELKAESAKNYLSYLWWVAEPALLITVFYFVFGVMFKRGGEGFASSLVIGVTAWLWFSGSVLKAMMSVRRETQLMLQVYVPKYVFPLASVMFSLVKQFFVILLILALLSATGAPKQYWYLLVLVFLVQFLLIISLSVLLSAIIPFIPDLAIVISSVLPMGMFVSGIFFTIDQVPQAYQGLYLMNPMAGLISEYRNVLLYERLPDFSYLFWVTASSLTVLLIGMWMLKRFDRVYPRLAN